MIDVLESMLVCLVNWEGWSLGLQIEVNESTGTRLDRPLGSKGRVLCLVPGGDLTVRHRLLVVIGEVFAVRLPCSLEIIVFSTMHKGRWSTICNRVVLFLYKVFGKHVTLTVSPGVRGAICSVLESGVDFDRGVHVFWFVLSGVVGITISACRSLFELTCRLIDTFEFVLNLAELAHDLLLGSQSQCARVVLV